MKKKNIPFKNYIISALLFLGVIFLFIYAFSWYQIKEQEKLLESYLIKTNTINYIFTDLKELNTALVEAPDNYFLFTGYTNDALMQKTEKKMKTIIDSHNLNDQIYYLDITNNLDDEEFLKSFNKSFDIDIISFPVILYFKDDLVVEVIESNDNDELNLTYFKDLLSKLNTND